MKKLMLMMVVMGTVVFGRDFEYREKAEIEQVIGTAMITEEMSPREVQVKTDNLGEYSDFHMELMNMDRGHQDR